MKKLLLLVLLSSAFITALAQAPHSTKIDSDANKLSRALARKLELNEHGFILIKNLTAVHLTAQEKIKAEYSYNPQLQEQKMAEAEFTYQRRLQLSLRARQLDNYLALRKQKQPVLYTSLTK